MQFFINTLLISISIANTVGIIYIAKLDKNVIKAVSNFDLRLKVIERLLSNKDIISKEEAEEILSSISSERDSFLERSLKNKL